VDYRDSQATELTMEATNTHHPARANNSNYAKHLRISMFHRAFFNSIIDKHQHMHFFTTYAR